MDCSGSYSFKKISGDDTDLDTDTFTLNVDNVAMTALLSTKKEG